MEQFDADRIHMWMRNSLRDKIVSAIQHVLRFQSDQAHITISALDANNDVICRHRAVVFEDPKSVLVKIEVSEIEIVNGIEIPEPLYCVGTNDLKNTEEVINFLYSVTYLRGVSVPNFKCIELSPTRIR